MRNFIEKLILLLDSLYNKLYAKDRLRFINRHNLKLLSNSDLELIGKDNTFENLFKIHGISIIEDLLKTLRVEYSKNVNEFMARGMHEHLKELQSMKNIINHLEFILNDNKE